jgi:uncharacterized repeat protein (TIGR03847 family)
MLVSSEQKMTSDLGTARAIDAVAHGEPGQRTFQVRVLGDGSQSASLWLEKQHLLAMTMAFTQLLAQLGQRGGAPATVEDFPESPDHQLRVGRMSIGYDPSGRVVVLHVFAEGRDEDEDDPDVLVRLSQPACAALNVTLEEIIAAGRPLCPLCGAPMESGGHTCIRSNGHSKQPIPEDRVDDVQSD